MKQAADSTENKLPGIGDIGNLRAVILGMLLVTGAAGCAGLPEARYTDDLFMRYEIPTAFSGRQTVLSGFFRGGATADIAVVHRRKDHQGVLQLFSFDGSSWNAALKTTLNPGTRFVDRLNVDGRDRLIFYHNGALQWLDPESGTGHALLEIDIEFKPVSAAEIQTVHMDISRDVNHDGLDDLVLPQTDGFWIAIQLPDGRFSPALKLGPPEPFLNAVATGDQHRYGAAGVSAQTIGWYQSRVHEMDHNLDGRSDLVFWNQDHFDVYYQKPNGQFEAEATNVSADIDFDSDGVYSLVFAFGDDSTFSLISGFRPTSKQTVLQSLRDMNGDGIADLTTLSLEGRSIFNQHVELAVYSGVATPSGVAFSAQAGTRLIPLGGDGGLYLGGYATQNMADLGGDAGVDVFVKMANTGPTKMVRAMVGNSITLDLEFYRMADGVYPDQPTDARRIRPKIDIFSRRGPFFPLTLFGDISGDGRAELLVGRDWNNLDVYAGVEAPGLFAQQPQTVSIEMPRDERHAWLADLNQDKRQDLLILVTSDDNPNRLAVLMAR